MKIDVKFATDTFAPIFGSTTEIKGGYSQEEVDSIVAATTGAFWDAVQNFGNREDYNRAFRHWNCELLRPKYKVAPTNENSAAYLFHYNRSLKKVEAQYFDFSQKARSSSTGNGYSYFCGYCFELEEVEDVGMQPDSSMQYAFYHCYKLHTIARIRVDENTQYNSTFTRCDSLENLTVEGTIGKNGFNVSWSPLSHDSLINIIKKLGETGSALSITLGTDNLAKLTDAEKAVATEKGWSLA